MMVFFCKHLKRANPDAQQTRWMDILTIVNPGTESNITENTLLSGIFVFLQKQRMPRVLTAFNLVFYTQTFLRKYLGVTYVKSLNCCVCCFLLIVMCMSKRTKSSITNLNAILAVVSLCPFLTTSATFKIRYFAQVVVDSKSCNGTQVRVLMVQTAEVALGHWVWQSQSLSSRSSILHLKQWQFSILV